MNIFQRLGTSLLIVYASDGRLSLQGPYWECEFTAKDNNGPLDKTDASRNKPSKILTKTSLAKSKFLLLSLAVVTPWGTAREVRSYPTRSVRLNCCL